MAHALPMTVSVIDFRRQSMVLDWHLADGTWTACDVPPALVHGVALIRAAQPAFCLYGRAAQLHLQVNAQRFPLADTAPHIKYSQGLATLRLRGRFTVETVSGEPLFTQTSWAGQGDDFFEWLTARAARPEWRAAAAASWSDGMDPAELRSS